MRSQNKNWDIMICRAIGSGSTKVIVSGHLCMVSVDRFALLFVFCGQLILDCSPSYCSCHCSTALFKSMQGVWFISSALAVASTIYHPENPQFNQSPWVHIKPASLRLKKHIMMFYEFVLLLRIHFY